MIASFKKGRLISTLFSFKSWQMSRSVIEWWRGINFLTNKIGDGRMNELVKVYNDGKVELRVEFKMIDG